MPGLNIYTSNRLEVLSQKLATVLATPLPDPFAREIIVVQSRGIARWLNFELARQHKICANVEYPFPRAFAYRIFARLQGSGGTDSPWDPEVLLWRIMHILPALLDKPGFESIRHYARGENGELRLHQLAGKIANVFDQYMVFRPELVQSWDRGEEDHWQALLWRELAATTAAYHPARLRDHALDRLHRSTPALGEIPERISIFGISALPKFYLDLFAGLSLHREVNCFLIQPTQESWDHITSSRESERLAAKANLSQADLHLEEGHPLLASWGALGREFFRNIMDCDPHREDLDFIPAPSNSLLHQLQNDILELRDRSDEKGIIEHGDNSLLVHSCHSAIRELEVLRDHMLAWFQADPTLHPRDILVMMPEVESYTPLIQAVFDVPEERRERIPFSIADRSARDESRIAEAFLGILQLPDTRCTAREILALLECRSLLARFELNENDLELIHRWVLESGIRWGMDGEHRSTFDLPAFDQNSWEAGLDRLLLGYAMIGDGEHLFENTLPMEDVEGSNAEILGRFVRFAKTLFHAFKILKAPRPLEEWAIVLQELLNTFFAADLLSEEEHQFVRGQCNALRTQRDLSGYDGAIPLGVVRTHLAGALERGGLAGGFLDGGVTFCALKPMRSLPFKVICLLGMNDTAFPRQNLKIGFDLLQQQPRSGDPSARKDDQYLFLETLLAARERLHISYIGQSARDNKLQPPSVLVSELLDCVQRSFTFADGPVTESDLVVKHRLQAFSAEYFKGGRLFTFSQANARALKAQQRERQQATPFITGPLPEPAEEFRSIRLEDLAEFLAHPTKHFLRKRLRLELGRDSDLIDDVEPFTVGGLEGYQLKQHLLERCLSGQDITTTLELLQAQGVLPCGKIGESRHRDLCSEVASMAERIGPQGSEPRQVIAVDYRDNGFSLTGELQVSANGLLQYRCAKIKGSDILRAWVNHVALNAVQPAGVQYETVLVGSDALHAFGRIENAAPVLQSLLELYWEGLRQPLKLFPSASFAFAKLTFRPGRAKRSPIQAARAAWETNDFVRGEQEDPWFHFCFQGTDPLDAEFAQLSLRVFEPLFTALKPEGEGEE